MKTISFKYLKDKNVKRNLKPFYSLKFKSKNPLTLASRFANYMLEFKYAEYEKEENYGFVNHANIVWKIDNIKSIKSRRKHKIKIRERVKRNTPREY